MTYGRLVRSRMQMELVCGVVLAIPGLCCAELSLESCCQIAARIGSRQVEYLGKVDVLTEYHCEDTSHFAQYASDPKGYLEQREAFRKELADAKAAVFSAYRTTEAEVKAFADANEAAIAEHLAGDPDAKAAIDAVSSVTHTLQQKLEVSCYCLLTIASARQKIEQVKDQIASLQASPQTLEVLLEREPLRRMEWDAKIKALFRTFDTSSQEYLFFANKHGRAVQKYLEGHPAIKTAIDDLSGQVRALLEEYDELREAVTRPQE